MFSNGIEVCKNVCKFLDILIVMVADKDAVPDKVETIDIGADDYITKPFAIEELLARIRSLLGRNSNNNVKSDILRILNLIIDKEKYKIDDLFEEKLIKTARGVDYILRGEMIKYEKLFNLV